MTGFDVFALGIMGGGLVCAGLVLVGAVVPAAVVAVLAGLVAVAGLVDNTSERVDRKYCKPTKKIYRRDRFGLHREVIVNPDYKPNLKTVLLLAGVVVGLLGLLALGTL
jgi:hypothetical protein